MEIVRKQYCWFFSVIAVMLLQRRCDCCLEEERTALLQIKYFFNDSSDLFSWGLLNVDCCNWERVECNKTTGRVIKLDLSYLSGRHTKEYLYLNASLFLPLQQLKTLLLYGNQFNGCVRNEGFERLSKFSNLEFLGLDRNNFNDTILSSISGLSSLKYLHLSTNRLQGTNNISELQKLRNLEILDLRYNQLNNNNIISILKGLSSLKELYLAYNQLEGHFNLKELHNLKSLEELDLSGNRNISKFVGSTDEISPIKLIVLYLDEMIIDGRSQLLESLRVFPYLKALYLRESNFIIGASFGSTGFYNWSNLKELYLDGSFMDENFLLSIEATLPSLKVLSCVGMKNPLGSLNFNYLEHLYTNYSTFSNSSLLQDIGNMKNLKSLSLQRCGLNYSISINKWVCELPYLQKLDLRGNSLHGILPLCLSNLTSLEYLDLSDNIFQIPISLSPFFNHSKLNYFDVGGNNISAVIEDQNSTPKFQLKTLFLYANTDNGGGELPKFLYYQHNLQFLDLSHNKIRGEFPFWLLDNNTKLEYLVFANNSLSGPMKLPIHSHMNLSTLDVSENYFHARIPKEFGEYFPSLRSLYMSTNSFNGNIPSSFGNMSLLQYLDIFNNSLSGQIPNSMGNLTSLEFLNLSENNISGILPFKFSPPSIIEIHLSKNNLQGSLRDVFYNSPWLVVLDLSQNNFEGPISGLFGDNMQLGYIILSHNNFEGELPVQLCNLGLLSLIDFSHNNLSGTILPCLKCNNFWFKYETSSSIDYRLKPQQPLDFTNKNSSYSYQPTTLELFSGIDLSSSKFMGQIPLEIGNLGEIQVLNLSHNSLIGPIPQSFSNLKRIESLDLSYNNLGGQIPPQLTQLTALEFFSVAYNNLSGRTPERVDQFGTFEPSCYEGNPFLCGLPLPNLCNTTMSASPPTNTSMDEQEDNGFIDMDAFRETFVGAYIILLLGTAAILYINPYWRRAWFYYAELVATTCYYFLIDNIPFLSKLGIS